MPDAAHGQPASHASRKESGSVGTRPAYCSVSLQSSRIFGSLVDGAHVFSGSDSVHMECFVEKISCIASFVEFDAYPAYVDTSAMTSATPLEAYAVRTHPTVMMFENALSCSICVVYCWSGYGGGPGPLAGFTTTTKRSSG